MCDDYGFNQYTVHFRMMRCLILICVVLAGLFLSVHSKVCNVPQEAKAETILKNDLFCLYNPYVRSKSQRTGKNNVTMVFSLKYLDPQTEDNTVIVHGAFDIHWHDDFLMWEPADYDGIAQININTNQLWIPKLKVLNSAWDTHRILDRAVCILFSSGTVMCVLLANVPVMCNLELKYWPHDSQACELYVMNENEEFRLQFPNNGDEPVNFYFEVPNQSWKYLNFTGNIVATGKTELITYAFILERYATAHRSAIFVPTIVVTALVLMSFWQQAASITRVALCCTSIITDTLFIQYIGYIISATGDSVPTIIKFYRDAMCIAVVALVIGFLVKIIAETKQEAPSWLVTAVVLLLRCKIVRKYLGTGEIENPATQTWGVLANLIDRVAFVTMLTISIILMVGIYAPPPSVQYPEKNLATNFIKQQV